MASSPLRDRSPRRRSACRACVRCAVLPWQRDATPDPHRQRSSMGVFSSHVPSTWIGTPACLGATISRASWPSIILSSICRLAKITVDRRFRGLSICHRFVTHERRKPTDCRSFDSLHSRVLHCIPPRNGAARSRGHSNTSQVFGVTPAHLPTRILTPLPRRAKPDALHH